MVTNQDSLKEAKALVSRILQLARAHENKALMQIDTDPETGPLLALLPERQSMQAQVHLEASRIWRAKQNRKAEGKLDAARKALDRLDLVLARGILRKIDSSVLDEPTLARYDELLLAVEARAVELDEIQSRLPESQPVTGQTRRRRFWKR